MKKFISFIYGYHTTLYLLDKESNYHLGTCFAMLDLGYSVELLVFGDSVKVEDDPNYDSRIKVTYINSYWGVLRYIKDNSDAVIYSNTFSIPSLLIGLVAKKSIFFSHDPVFPDKYSSYFLIKKLFVYFCYIFFTKIRVINAYEKEWLSRLGFGNKGVIIPLVISSSNLNLSVKETNNILLLGHVFPKKDPISILKSLQIVVDKYPDIMIYQVGNYRNYRDSSNRTYDELVKHYGLLNNMTLLGRRKESLKELNLNTSIYVNSSLMEGQCIAVYDASLLGNSLCLPHMSSFLGVLDNKVKYHPIGDYKILANNIIRYIEHPKEKIKMIKDNQLWILKNHSYNRIQSLIKQEFNLS